MGKELHAAYPDNVGFKNGLAVSYAKLGQFHQEGDPEKARAYFSQAERLWDELVKAFPDYVEFGRNLGNVRSVLEGLGM